MRPGRNGARPHAPLLRRSGRCDAPQVAELRGRPGPRAPNGYVAAIPEPAVAPRWLPRLGLGACGLAQFKNSFGPDLHARHAAAPPPPFACLGLAAVAWAIHRPAPLRGDRRGEAPAWRGGRSGVAALARWPVGPS
jgi:hypothetical protein